MKEHVIEVLRELATLMDLAGENPFKVKAYNNAARSLEKECRDFEEIVRDGQLTQISGIGAGIAGKIMEIVDTGTCSLLMELREKIPAGLVKMLEIPGLGAKRIRTLKDKLNIENIEQLELACEEGEVARLRGFGEKTTQNIVEGIHLLKQRAGLFSYDQAITDAMQIVGYLKKKEHVYAIEIAGSLRRNKELVHDVDMVTASDNPTDVMANFINMQQVQKVLGHGDTKSSIHIQSGLQVDLRVVSQEQFPFALMYLTGSKEHNTAMRNRAKKMGLKLNEYGLFRDNEPILCHTEADIFRELGLDYIAPELREDMGEIAAAEKHVLPKLLTLQDIKGIFHVHTTYSDGLASLRDMAIAARDRGYQYLGITDHSQSLTIGNGMKPKLVYEQFREIEELNEELKPFRIFKGIESDILGDGSLDYETDLLAQFEFVIGSIHTKFRMPEAKMTQRVIRAIENPFLTMLGHPTGRLLLKRAPIAINMQAVIDAAVANNVIIEINSHPLRLDLEWRWGLYAREHKLMTSINPDAHNIDGMDLIEQGVGIARKGWFEPDRVFNTLPVREIAKYFDNQKEQSIGKISMNHHG